jgi:hypothetical protein
MKAGGGRGRRGTTFLGVALGLGITVGLGYYPIE